MQFQCPRQELCGSAADRNYWVDVNGGIEMKKVSVAFATSILLLAVASAFAERSTTFGRYIIHYNALGTDIIAPAVAQAYGITRSKNRALVNISVLQEQMGTHNQPVVAEVSGTATNLNAQLQKLHFRQAGEGGAVYYIAELGVSHLETLRFRIEVTPEGQTESHVVEFEQQFFTD